MFYQSKTFKIISSIIIFLALPIIAYSINQTTNFIGEAIGTKADLKVDLKRDSSISVVPWINFAQGGEERDGMLESVTTQVAKLKPRYIRIDHVYDFYETAKRGNSGELVYDWTNLDKEIMAIEKMGAKPFLSLSYMPAALATDNEVSTPISWDEWRALVKETVEHVSGKDGLAIDNVYYEIWNEPDLFGDYKLEGEKNYLNLYKYSHLGVQDAENLLSLKIGGPATTALYKNWFFTLLDYCRENKLRIDFYSWHRYSKDIGDYESDISSAKEWALNYPDYVNMEFIISEFGHTSEVDEGYDNELSAAHTMALSASILGKIQKIFTFEVKDGPGQAKYWGRWGMLTHEKWGIPTEKPRYKAIEFLNLMKGDRYFTAGQGSWVKAFTMGDSGAIRTLIVNYDSFNKHFENVPIEFTNLPSKKFILRKIKFMGAISEKEIVTENNSFSTEIPMDANSAIILEIYPR